jgi:glycolate oxidase FAD binding subunit
MIADKIRSLIGEQGVVGVDARGATRVAPATDEECMLILRTASSEKWHVRIEGTGNWIQPDAPAEIAITTSRMTGVTDLNPPDLVASVRSGTKWEEVRTALANEGTWITLDPPGSTRSVGSIVACATAGPLRTGFGTVRDQLLGLTLITADGRQVKAGGKVVKNVAGYDLTKLVAGSYGAFGIITSVNIRLHAVPRADVTLIAHGHRDSLLGGARQILEAGITPAALELVSPAAAGHDAWLLAMRLIGSDEAVRAEQIAIAAVAPQLLLIPLEARDGANLWNTILAGVTEAPTTLRIGALSTSLTDVLDMVAHHLDENCDDWITANVLSGVVRWSGSATTERLRLLRGTAAQREMPVTLERSPWSVRSEMGHFGAYRDGIGRVIHLLRRSFDAQRTLVVPLGEDS